MLNFDLSHMGMVCFLFSALRFAVPCFIMLAGAFALDNDKNGDYGFYYKKIFQSVGIPMLVFSALYVVYSLLKQGIVIWVYGGDTSLLWDYFKTALSGEPFYHLWYLYMMIGVYVLVPVVIRVKRDIGEARFAKAAWVFLVLAIISLYTSTHTLNWDIGFSFCFLGYFMVGYVLYKNCKKHTMQGVCWILLGLAIGSYLSWLRYLQAAEKIADRDLLHPLADPWHPLVALLSICIFVGFVKLDIRADVRKIASLTFYMYLIHPVIWDVESKLLSATIGAQADARVVILLSTLLVSIAAMIFAKIYLWLYRAVAARY